MRTRGSRRAIVAAGVAVAGAIGVLAACSSDELTTAAAQPPRECPVDVASAIGAACRTGQSCPIGYSCGAVVQQAACTCASGAFACNDSTGAPLHPGDTPACVPAAPPATCPRAETDLARCASAGQVCVYDGLTCPESTGLPSRDTCECTGNGDGGLVFHCVVTQCLPRADAAAGVPEAGSEGGAPDAGVPDTSIPDADDAG
jgi:hypothetical protein